MVPCRQTEFPFACFIKRLARRAILKEFTNPEHQTNFPFYRAFLGPASRSCHPFNKTPENRTLQGSDEILIRAFKRVYWQVLKKVPSEREPPLANQNAYAKNLVT
jgi:hypothetical protein